MKLTQRKSMPLGHFIMNDLAFLCESACTILRNGYKVGWLPAVCFIVISEKQLPVFQRIIDFLKSSTFLTIGLTLYHFLYCFLKTDV